MTNQRTLTLRAVALELGKSQAPNNSKIADGKLLGLLKSGELTAGFEFPGLVTRWVPIPATYWMRITSDKFRGIRRGGNSRADGTYKVRVSSFVDEYFQLV
jgi:hypothetical protein